MRSRSEFGLHLWRYSVLLIASVVLLAVICVMTVDAGAFADERKIEFRRLDLIAAQIEEASIQRVDAPQILQLINELDDDGHQIEWLDLNGLSYRKGTRTPLATEEFEMAKTNVRGWRKSETKAPALFLARAVISDSKLFGFLTVKVPVQAIVASTDRMKRSIVVGSCLVLLVGLVISYVMARQQAEGVELLRQYIGSLAAGAHELNPPRLSTWELDNCVKSLKEIAREMLDRIQRGARNKKEIETILTSMGEGLLAINLDERLILMNEPAKQILGMTTLTPMPATLADLPHGEELHSMIASTIREATSISGEIEFPDENSIVEIQIAPLRDENKSIGGVVCLLSDVTAIRRLENLRRDFIANVSHELKTPLTVIQGAAETILNDEDMPVAIRSRFLSRVVENSRRLDQLINDILELSRLQSSTQDLNMEQVDLNNTVRDCIGGLEGKAARKDISLISELEEERALILGDRRTVHSIIENLVANAVNYTKPGGAVSISVCVENSSVVIEVVDSGEGIPLEHQSRIFERFYRVDGARSREVGGTGLGLAIVKNSVQAHGGQITLKSEVGIGSTFRVRFPLYTES
ncbi:MAG: two-component system phosphate regulon sensor histidine kinase PhoR [Planctomycetota bacterium]|jgi:two-component system phosphate regulon sensor histidine kinase PhoR